MCGIGHGKHDVHIAREQTPAFNRRVVLRAASGLAMLAAGLTATTATVGAQSASSVSADGSTTRAGRYVPELSIDAKAGETDPAGFRTFTADYPFFALGASWDGGVGTWPVLDVETSVDGITWSDTVQLMADTIDGGQPSRDGRLFTGLTYADGATQVRFRAVDANGNLGSVDGLSFVYIDASNGPWEHDVTPETIASNDGGVDTMTPPKLLTREAWGADESYRFEGYEIWPPLYSEVRHVIIHHTETPTEQDPLVAMRSIYYYHAVERGWGDIGYNYLVDKNGTIYEGRYGGQNVIGGHSYEYADGSSGICIIGNYQDHAESDAARAGLVEIAAWTARYLDPLGSEDFHEIPNLPTICAHRDVNSTQCPGDILYSDVPYIRTLVAQTLESGVLDSGAPGGIAPHDRVVVQTDDGSALNIRAEAGSDASVVDVLPNGSVALVVEGPVAADGENWYHITWDTSEGWTIARYLIVSPPAPVADDGSFGFGVNLRLNDSANLRSDTKTTASVITYLPAGTWAAMEGGPVWDDGHTWYYVATASDGKGWVAAEYLGEAPFDEHPNAKYVVGDVLVANDTFNVRIRPGAGQTVGETLQAGTRMTVSVSPVGVSEDIWYGVYGDFGGGWVAEVSLDPVS